MKKKLVMLLVGTMLAAQFTGCGGGSGQKSDSGTASESAESEAAGNGTEGSESSGNLSGEVVMWTWDANMEQIVNNYNDSHPGTNVEMVIVDAGEYMTKLQTTLASGGDLPDIVWGEILNRGILFEMDILDVLTEAPYNLDPETIDQSVVPTMKNANGDVVGVEANLNPSGLAYRRSAAKEYFGTDDPQELEAMFPTWDEFIKKGQEVAEKSGGKVTMLTSLGDIYYMISGQSDSLRVEGETIHTKAAEELFTKICQFRDAGIVSQIEQWTPAWYASFASIEGADTYSIFSPMPNYGESNFIVPADADANDWGLMVPPEGGFSWGGTACSITKDSQNKELAWDFLNYVIFGEGADYRFENNGEVISVAGYMTGERVEAEHTAYGGQKVMEVYINEILPTMHTNPVSKYDYADICAIELVLNALNTDYSMTPQAAVDTYVSEMQEQAPELAVD